MLTLSCSVRDWLYGVNNTEPDPANVEPQTEAERLRVIYHMITVSKEEGGAEIAPGHDEWKNIDAIFSLHDEETNNRCLRDWSKKTFLSAEDLDQLRGQFGESVCAFSSAFLHYRLLSDTCRWLFILRFYSRTSSSWCSRLSSGSLAGCFSDRSLLSTQL